MGPPLGARHSPASPRPPFHPGVRARPSPGCPAPPAGSLRTSDRPAAGPCVLPPSGAPAAAPARREASLRRVVELAPLDLADDVGLARRPAAAAQHDRDTLDQRAQPLVPGGVQAGAGGALVPGAEPRVGGVHLGQLPDAEALGVLGREDAGVHRSLPGRGPFRPPYASRAGNPRATAARAGAAEPGGSSLIGGLQSIPAKNPRVRWPTALRLRLELIPDRDG